MIVLIFLCLSDNQGILLEISAPISGNHHDVFEFEQHFKEILNWLEEANIETEGLFLNADAGFDTQACRKACQKAGIEANIDFNKRNGNQDRFEYFDEELYKRRWIIERTFAWMDAFKALLVRYEKKEQNWLAFNLIAIIVIFIRKIQI